MEKSREKLALALDNVSSREEIEKLIKITSQWVGVYKIGLEQFTRFGPPILELVRKQERKIFLDLKFHDIPNTVSKAVSSACELGVHYMTIHTQGGVAMMQAAAEAASKAKSEICTKIIGVTLLTSINAHALAEELAIQMDSTTYVQHLATLAIISKLNGIVCSAADLPGVKEILPEHFEVITPGIRPSGSDIGDQARIATPKEAIQNGATLLVVGRPITGAKEPGEAAEIILREISDTRQQNV
ncbi:MAG TPA: orotidine-5'-phosphate decarboxylase [Chitinispirillaceae bacterium]|nr:orotidine-5'-phosphate decarboxylase [Chitinispirillaceae bacterium]